MRADRRHFGVVGEDADQLCAEQQTCRAAQQGDQQGDTVRAPALAVCFVKFPGADQMPDEYLRRLPDGDGKQVKKHGDVLHICFGDQLAFRQAPQHDRGDDQLRKVVEKGFERRRHADFEHLPESVKGEGLEQPEHGKALDFFEQDHREHHAAHQTAGAGRNGGACHAHGRHEQQVGGGVENIHAQRDEHRDLCQTVVADDHRDRTDECLQKDGAAHNGQILSGKIKKLPLCTDEQQDRAVKQQKHHADRDAEKELQNDRERRYL